MVLGAVRDAAYADVLKAQNQRSGFSQQSFGVFPTSPRNASVIGTGHGLGDTGDYSNSIYPGAWLSKPDPTAAVGSIAPFLENDQVLANMNSIFEGNYLRERTLLSLAGKRI